MSELPATDPPESSELPELDDAQWVSEQMLERLRFYQELTPLGLSREAGVTEPPVPAAEPRLKSQPRAQPRHEETHQSEVAVAAGPETAPRESLDAIRADLGECTRCRLHEGRQKIVFGQGNPNAELMFIGEGPGFEEDRQGLAFVGPAGQLLTKIIEAIGMSRDDVFIANVVKCRPPKNRDPEPDEVATCRPFLERQIDAIQPKVLCTLGRIAAVHLLETSAGITRIRGQVFDYRGMRLVPTYHPAYLLRNPERKRETWEDMKLVRSLLEG